MVASTSSMNVSAEVITKPQDQKINWPTVLVLIVLHVGAIGALFCFSWRALLVSLFLYWMTIGLGISLGYHRLHTHRSYKVPVLLEYFFAVCGAMTLEGGPFILGCDSSHTSSEVGSGRRPTFAE